MNKELNLQVAKRGLTLPETFKLDMKDYCSDGRGMPPTNSCGTSFCFAGYLAAEDNYPVDYREGNRFRYEFYSEGLLEGDERCWEWFFCGTWPSTFKDLKDRCQYVINNNGTIPKEFSSIDNDWVGKEITELKGKLNDK